MIVADVLAPPTPKSNFIARDFHGATIQVEQPQLLHEDLWSQAPPWGGNWSDFFGLFRTAPDGLTRSEIYSERLGDEQIFSQNFQYVIQSAINDGLLLTNETHRDVTLLRSGLAIVQRDSEERLMPNLTSVRLRELMSERNEKIESKVRDFLSIDFAKLALVNNQESVASESYGRLFLKILAELGDNKVFFRTNAYNQGDLNPNEDKICSADFRSFIDSILDQAQEIGILKDVSENGRSGFVLAVSPALFSNF